MHRSGLVVSEELKKVFADATEGNVGHLKVEIVDEDYVLTNQAARQQDFASELKQAQQTLEPTKPAFVVTFAHSNNQWVLVAYVPDKAQVKQKMVYAASRSSFKDQLGGSSFLHDFFLTNMSECTLKDYEASKKQDAGVEALTVEEYLKKEAQYDSRKAVVSVKVAAIADIPIKVSEDAAKQLESFKNSSGSGADSSVALLFHLDETTEVLHAATESKFELEDLAAKLPVKEPRYVLVRYPHEADGAEKASVVFVYYCPDSAPPKQKMFYSSCKSMVLKIVEKYGIEVAKNFEISEPKEFTNDAILDVLYPKSQEKQGFSKPKRQGKGPARLNAKFTPT